MYGNLLKLKNYNLCLVIDIDILVKTLLLNGIEDDSYAKKLVAMTIEEYLNDIGCIVSFRYTDNKNDTTMLGDVYHILKSIKDYELFNIINVRIPSEIKATVDIASKYIEIRIDYES